LEDEVAQNKTDIGTLDTTIQTIEDSYLHWDAAFGWTDDLILRNNTSGLFLEKKQKVLHNGTPGVQDIVTYNMPIELSGISTDITY
jgi:hypothetical protein